MEKPRISIVGYNTPMGQSLNLILKGAYQIEPLTEADFKLPRRELAERLNGTRVIINVAGMPFYAKWTSKYEYDLYANRMAYLKNLVDTVSYMKVKPEAVITLSNAMLYNVIEVHDDYSTEFDDGFLAEVGLMETNETLKLQKVSPGTRIVILRAGYIMAKNSPGFRILKKAAQLGVAGIVDKGYQCMPLVWDIDLSRAIAFAVEMPQMQGIYNVTIPQMASLNELVQALEKGVGFHQKSLPRPVLKLLAGRAIEMLEHNCKVVPARLTAIGFKFQCENVEQLVNVCL